MVESHGPLEIHQKAAMNQKRSGLSPEIRVKNISAVPQITEQGSQESLSVFVVIVFDIITVYATEMETHSPSVLLLNVPVHTHTQ